MASPLAVARAGDCDMTTKQDEVLNEAMVKLGEHFEHVVIVCDAPDMEFPSDDGPSLFTRHKGSTWTCCGMMRHYITMMSAAFMEDKDRPRDEDESPQH